MVRSEGDRLRRVVVCAPRREYFQVENTEGHNIGCRANPEKTSPQPQERRAVLRHTGARVVEFRELTHHPNSVFARDAGLVTPLGYIKLRMGLRTRRGEEDWMASALDSLGVPCAGKIEKPGTVEGGDVILAGEVAFVGLSERTNRSGGPPDLGPLGVFDLEIFAPGRTDAHPPQPVSFAPYHGHLSFSTPSQSLPSR